MKDLFKTIWNEHITPMAIVIVPGIMITGVIFAFKNTKVPWVTAFYWIQFCIFGTFWIVYGKRMQQRGRGWALPSLTIVSLAIFIAYALAK